MGVEGGGRFERLERRFLREDPSERGIESRGDRDPEDGPERESNWLAEMGITPETIERMRQAPALEASSTEYIIYMLLLGKRVEEGVEWDPQRKAQVSNLIGVLRAIAYPNMTAREQASLEELAGATSINMAGMQYEVAPGVVSDIRWIWRTFGLKRPTQGFGASLLVDQPPRPQLRPRN